MSPRRIGSPALAALVLLSACASRSGDGGEGTGRRDSGSGPGADGGRGPGTDGATVTPRDCSAEARWIYVVDQGNALLRFQPDDLSFTRIGPLDCDPFNTPFSMAVDRDAVAWVLYQDGRIHHVSTTDASCRPTSFAPRQMGFELFGMGFASDAEGSTEETLYIGGGSALLVGEGSAVLGTIDESSLAVSSIGALAGWPELTGTGSGELWGFFPETRPRSVRQIEKTTGANPVSFPLDALGTDTAQAWAFAFWGGRFYVFLQTASSGTTDVWRLDPRDGTVERVVTASGYSIVGAGVSTCAPIELI